MKVYLLTKISEGLVNKFRKISEGVYRNRTMSTSISKGLRKIVNFRGGSTKNSKFPKGSSEKPFPKGSKISNLVNRGVWILNGMALGAMSSTNYSLTV
jgi:hypothetical protein